MRLVLIRDFHFICIFIDAIKLELLTLTFQSAICEDLNSHQTITLLLQSKRLNQLKPLATIVYKSHLPNPTPRHHLSVIRYLLSVIRYLLSVIRYSVVNFFYKRLGEE